MQSVSQTYSALIAGDHTKQVRIIIGEDSDDMILSENSLYSMETEASLFASRTLSFGGCVSKTITVKLDPGSMIVPRMAKLRPQVRLRHGSTVSEWLTKGVYYVDTREYDETTGILTLTGYDAMLMAEETYIRESDVGQWPRTMPQVVSDIVSRLGVSLDGRTSLTAYTVQLPVGYTMREVLGYIAAAHAGNWVMTDEGKLRLITADETVDCAVLDDSVMTLKTDDAFDEITKVDLSVTDDTYVEAGDDTGRKISLFCPWGTEQMAIDILGRFDGFVYRPYTADGAVLDPAYEIGDNAAVGSFTGMIVTQDLTFNSLCLSNISAPAEDEIDHEYPYQSSFRRMVERKIRSTEATLKVETDAIIARVEGLADNSISGVSVQYALGDSSSSTPTSGWSATPPAWVSGKYIWQKTVTTYTDNATSKTYTAESQPFCVPNDGTGISSIVSEYYLSDSYVEQTGGSWGSTVPAWQEGKYIWTRTHVYYTGGTDTYTAPVLNLSSDDLGKKYAELKVTVDGIDLTGYVTFNALSGSGQSTINGDNITTGTITGTTFKVVTNPFNYKGVFEYYAEGDLSPRAQTTLRYKYVQSNSWFTAKDYQLVLETNSSADIIADSYGGMILQSRGVLGIASINNSIRIQSYYGTMIESYGPITMSSDTGSGVMGSGTIYLNCPNGLYVNGTKIA